MQKYTHSHTLHNKKKRTHQNVSNKDKNWTCNLCIQNHLPYSPCYSSFSQNDRQLIFLKYCRWIKGQTKRWSAQAWQNVMGKNIIAPMSTVKWRACDSVPNFRQNVKEVNHQYILSWRRQITGTKVKCKPDWVSCFPRLENRESENCVPPVNI